MHCWREPTVQPPWKTVWRFLKKLKLELPYDPAIPLLSVYSKKMRSAYIKHTKDTCIPMFTAALFTIAKLKNHLRHRSTDEWIKKMCINTH
jgi:hypothetical protein